MNGLSARNQFLVKADFTSTSHDLRFGRFVEVLQSPNHGYRQDRTKRLPLTDNICDFGFLRINIRMNLNRTPHPQAPGIFRKPGGQK